MEWMVVQGAFPCDLGRDTANLTAAPVGEPPVATPPGVVVAAHDPATGARRDGIATRLLCPPPGEAPQPPPPPPSPAQVWEAIPLPAPTVNRSPVAEGLVGLGTWLWADAVAPVVLDLSLGGYALTVTAKPASFHWDISDGATYSSDRPGTEADPAATHVFQHGGEHTIAHRVIWSGSYTFTGYGITETVDLGTIDRDANDPIPVREIQAVIG